ncbi:MAG: hypothetical protein K2W92_05120 [Alphaproteobacteria bacterium]|nr:hypothetical protein [Alphaproteobacteria bacterium]
MQKTEACVPPYSNRHTFPFYVAKTIAGKETAPSSPLHFSNIKKATNRCSPPLSSAKNELFHEGEQKLFPHDHISFEEAYAQVKNCLSLIKDPLWKSVCIEMTDMMGPSAVLKMWNSRLGSFSHHHKTMDLYCQTEEIAQFIRQYSFVILGSLQRYFPMIKEVKIKIK